MLFKKVLKAWLHGDKAGFPIRLYWTQPYDTKSSEEYYHIPFENASKKEIRYWFKHYTGNPISEDSCYTYDELILKIKDNRLYERQ
jgi:hypothetical protein